MTLHEELQLCMKSIELEDAGKPEEASKVLKTIPMPPWLAEWNKKYVGADYLRNSGWNLSAAEAEFGTDWLDRKD
ncbi:hypothetical protein FACS1894190_15660 [Spirochaetia bacterium]|nr:hypothetical protein FACS1894190_15660 [Spirochaetia bacterium]